MSREDSGKNTAGAAAAQSAPVKVVFIGAGALASKFHYPSLCDMPDVVINAICDLNQERAKKVAETCKVSRTYTDYREMLGKESFDAVYVVMPPQDSFGILQDCLSRGLHTFSEKPPALTTFQTRVLAETAEANHCISQIGFQRKYIPLVQKMHAMVTERGPVDEFLVEFVKGSPKGKPYYNGRIDILTCDAIHIVDTALWLGGSPLKALASSVRQSYTDQNVRFSALMQFQNGVAGMFNANWNSGKRYLNFAFHGQNCCALLDPESKGTFFAPEHPNGVTLTAAEAAGSAADHHVGGFFAENREFIDAVKARNPAIARSSFQASVKVMEAVELFFRNNLA